MVKRRMILFTAAATLVVGAAASVGQPLPPGLPPGTTPGIVGGQGFAGSPGAPFPPFMMPPLLVGATVPSPQEVCLEMSAARAGYFAYLRQRLGLTSAQAPLWRDVEAAVGEVNTAASADCAVLPAEPEKPAFPQVLSLAEQHLAARRQGLQSLRGPLLRLYEGLSPAQREIMDRAMPPPMIL